MSKTYYCPHTPACEGDEAFCRSRLPWDLDRGRCPVLEGHPPSLRATGQCMYSEGHDGAHHYNQVPWATPGIDLESLGNPRFLRLLEETKRIHQTKAAGYAGSENPDTWANFREATAWGLTPLEGCLVRMGDKYRRVQNLRRNAANDQVGESIRDTLMDLANYTLIAVCLMEEEAEAEAAAQAKRNAEVRT